MCVVVFVFVFVCVCGCVRACVCVYVSTDMYHTYLATSRDKSADDQVKLYHQPDCVGFDAFGRVMCGTLSIGDQVKVLGEGYSLDDDEDMAVKTVTDIWLYQGRYRVPVTSGMLVKCEARGR